ncbi:ubiquitin carboxyl-terminal hydrolase 8 isoform X1 [Eurytemora carolleeae]|uniref:ubiquitin carboxyl-terminal hydrolase 8 isoform X1 n=1 Tax=Eurytemora carolleeae TaxID=1294199 RepID=UPI000C76A656|nr:ubiquitin carboxyl-terminal hydrolase 8 isoform X1 [Eurytemora carolleeae]XP_023337910.1 ubiquitin carboxyl-terminal hydrolase 8 isoform X1 [Eurytemora carolleeae]XP_023337911.1 ubiquitin carboxyl-terminal hydrolase 8 isoform X1 [Eurytemora carolleeae]XP_023337912.1 ubiquitin carboxyl-terminal hydrolase 8 isoform X1 [Eurytemora carolleeae]XP_023337913.1 ubiquitin carboxyl-terminal hydrolase 8 isoform X1 [Eurytemora carolleeae]XP_023337914.1 ubiquitin carboxyl-terminal hydrolase 8 isoform X1|eukprot:XP_023337907.1 ubiquitin carboxyl-terminal hydrolase 8-like isoform X1 [Eurytemora affinis]
MAGLLEVEGELAELSVSRTKDNLEKELEWTKLCKTREDASNEEMKAALNQQAERLFEEIEELTAKNLEKDKREMELVQEIDKLRLRLKKESEKEMIGEARRLEERRKEEENRRRMRFKEEEAAKLKREVEEKRRIRKKAAAEQRRRDEEKGMEEERRREEARNRRRQEEKEYREKLKDEGSSSNSGMRRSYSSPNIARMLEKGPNEDKSPGISTPKFPKFDRAQKPSDIVKRDFAGVWGTTTKPGLTGLRNLGNTCYMNSILQCVSHTLPLSQYFESGRYQEDVNKYSETRGLVAYEFAALMQSLWSNQFKFISPADIKEAVGRIKVEFAGRDQQDSHEFACKLLEWLHEDTNRVQRPSKMPEIDNTTIPEAEACRKFWKAFLDRNQSIIVQLFYGLTKQTTQCLNCRAKSIKFQEFYNLNLFIPNGNSKSSLRDCLARFVQENRIDYTCEKCRKSDGAVQKMDIVKLPPFLIIHLERFYPDEEIFRSGEQKYRKKQNFVNFQLSDLNLGDFVSGTENSYSNFNLYAVSNHFGSLEGGHYTAVCYSKHMKRWYKYDDQDVTSISEGSVQSSAAYILFYSATNASNSLLPLG